MKNLIKWFAGFFEDQAGTASSKRLVLYFCMGFMYMIVKSSIQGKTVDPTVLYAISGVILFLIGAVTSEFFKKPENAV
jgi:predicted membrane channel-forming protein YqfA (hemolysin III family)